MPTFSGKTLTPGFYVGTIKAITEVLLEKTKEWSDQTKQIQVIVATAEGSIKHWFHDAGFISQSDYDKDGLLHGQQIPAGWSFKSTEGFNEGYLVNDTTKQRKKHNVSKVVIDGTERIMTDSKIDEEIAKGKEVTFIKESKCRTAQRILGEFAYNAGARDEVDFVDLIGNSVGFKVAETGRTNKSGDAICEVKYFTTAESMEEKLAEVDA